MSYFIMSFIQPVFKRPCYVLPHRTTPGGATRAAVSGNGPGLCEALEILLWTACLCPPQSHMLRL